LRGGVHNARMDDNMTTPLPHCPWCSALLPIPGAESCPSCGAALVTASGADPDIKGVTMLDTEAILRARAEVARPRSRILSFITGDMSVPETGGPASAGSLAAPSEEVRREMLRLQLEAERADREAETVALKSDVLAQRGIRLADMGVGIEAPVADAVAGDAPVADAMAGDALVARHEHDVHDAPDVPDAHSAHEADGAHEAEAPEADGAAETPQA